MKTMTRLMTVAMVAITMMAVSSCDEGPGWREDDYWFDVEEAVNAYFERYGDFGADSKTMADWFDYCYPYASNADYNSFCNNVESVIYSNQKAMARLLNGNWQGNLTMRYKENGQSVSQKCTVAWDFELSSNSDVSGRGQEVRYSEAEGTTTTAFSWYVNNEGGIEMSFDAASDDDDPINMIVAYSTLDLLSDSEFTGTLVGVNIDEEDDFSLTKTSYAKPSVDTRTVAIKHFGGAKSTAKAANLERNISVSNGHR